MPSQPNILLLLSDQHRYDWMGCAGCTFVDTPNMDRMAATGVRFSDASCNAPLCGPSRMSLLTGRHPSRLGVYINEHTLSSDVPTFAHALGLAGYHTLLCGRMHLMGPDQRHGFHERLVGDICRCYGGGPMTDFGDIAGSASSIRKAVEHAGPRDTPVLAYDRDVTAAFERFARTWKGGRPLFATVGWYGPHHPYCAPPDHYRSARERMAGDKPAAVDAPLHAWNEERAFRKESHGATPDQAAKVRANYAGMISYLDTLVGRVLKAAARLPGETIVIYTSDHGDSVGDHRLFGKCSFYESSVAVPLIVAPLAGCMAQPGAAPGTVRPYPVSLVDLVPTLCDLAGAQAPKHTDGESLMPLLGEGPVDDRAWAGRRVFSELELLRMRPVRMLKRDGYKAVYYDGHERMELFEYARDRHEACDLAGDPQHAERLESMRREILDGWDPAGIYRDVLLKMDDLDYQTRWGREVGMGPLELWKGGKGQGRARSGEELRNTRKTRKKREAGGPAWARRSGHSRTSRVS